MMTWSGCAGAAGGALMPSGAMTAVLSGSSSASRACAAASSVPRCISALCAPGSCATSIATGGGSGQDSSCFVDASRPWAAGFCRRVGRRWTGVAVALGRMAGRFDLGGFTSAPIPVWCMSRPTRYHPSTRPFQRCPSTRFAHHARWPSVRPSRIGPTWIGPTRIGPTRIGQVGTVQDSLREIERQATFSITVLLEMHLRGWHDPLADTIGNVRVLTLIPRLIDGHGERQPALEIAVIDEVLFGGSDLAVPDRASDILVLSDGTMPRPPRSRRSSNGSI